MVEYLTRLTAIKVFTVFTYIVTILSGVVGGFIAGMILSGGGLGILFALLGGALGWLCGFSADVFYYTSFVRQENILQELRLLRREATECNLKKELEDIKEILKKTPALTSQEGGRTTAP